MQSERWQSCTEIFHAALERPPDERAAFLDEACQEDEQLRRQVEVLLKYHDKSGAIDTPAFEGAPELLLDNADALIGQHLGHYRIDAVLGIGGMGVVYLACDEKLGRKVGLKLLPPSLVADATRLERLKREARTASALNHPNIVTIHEIGEADGTHYIATEFIEGITLRERLGKGPIPPNESLDIASQVASALGVAHRAGIVHRDIKPENIMLRPDGYVKVLDFGIAKYTQPETPLGETLSDLQVTTQPGLILGTTRYMSPEQARGQALDARTDIWSLGVVLYEMLAGRAPFEGETPTDIMAAVLMKEPLPLGQPPLELPATLQRIVERALQKEKQVRYQGAREMLDDLRQEKQELDLQEKSGASTSTSRAGSSVARQIEPRNFFTELKRRNVYKVAVAYAVVGWLVMQVAATVVPALHLPDTITTTVVVLTLLGFPIALILAWAFELTPEGIKLTRYVAPEQSSTRRTGRALNLIVTGALLLVIAFFIWERRQAKRPSPTETLDKSIAVLPFENRSDDKANTYFADGVQDEILTRLSKIADLKVIAHSSTQHYTSAPENVPEIARQLGVAHILKGSVQKSGDSVRINVQLIRAASDSRLWAETFDRKLTDLFSVQSEVARAIAEQLRAELTGLEKQVIAAKPTNNPEAYDAYLRGLAYAVKTARSSANDIAAQKYLREAVRLDPKFALSWAMLSYVDSVGYVSLSLQPTNELREEARQAAETALKLDPNLGEALIAEGHYYYACLKDYDTAERYFEQARKFLPNSSLIPETLAYVARRRGQWDRSESYFNEAERLDPRNVKLLSQHALSYIATRRFSEALRKVDQVLNITPEDSYPISLKASIAQVEGDLSRAAAILAPLHPNADNTNVLETQAYQAILERHPEQMITRLKKVLANPDPALGYNIGGLRFYLGWAQEVAGDHAAAQESWQQARRELEPLLKEQSRNYLLVSALAFSEMGLGDKAAALQLAESAMAGNPIEKDAVFGARPLEIFARVAAQTGETDRAIAAIEKLLSVSYGGIMERQLPLTPTLLRLDPMFDPLRNDPRFQRLAQMPPPEKPLTAVPAKSIAVLPFENRIEGKANAYFAEGVQDEILTRLSKIADLKVISRTSTQHYKSAPENLPEIARQLGVAHVVEGSVQKSGNTVRVNVQLIKAADDSHIWAETFDRKLTDIFAVESEVAKAIAEQLRAKLTGQEEQVIAAKPTDVPEAYDAYLRGLAFSLKTIDTPANSLGAQKYLGEAVRLDPKFALSWALLSFVEARSYLHQTLQPTVALREEARQAAETAITLQPNLGEAMLAKGQYHYACLKDYDTAVRYFEQARLLLPNDSRIPESLALVARRRGQWDRSETYFNEAERVDPRNVYMLTQHALSYSNLRRFPEALRKLDQVLNITPDDLDTFVLKAGIAQAEGDLARASALLAPLHPPPDNSSALETQAYQAILERRPEPVILRLKEILAKPDPALGFVNGELRFWLGWAQEVAGDSAAARESWRQARTELEPFLKEQPDNYLLMGELALVNMGVGDKAAAIALAERAMAAMPIEKDTIFGPAPVEILARVAARLGEPDRAIAALEKRLSIPGSGPLASNVPLTPALLRLDPMFDPLRNDPRFQKLANQ